jgi:hypothetical protein
MNVLSRRWHGCSGIIPDPNEQNADQDSDNAESERCIVHVVLMGRTAVLSPSRSANRPLDEDRMPLVCAPSGSDCGLDRARSDRRTTNAPHDRGSRALDRRRSQNPASLDERARFRCGLSRSEATRDASARVRAQPPAGHVPTALSVHPPLEMLN